MTPQEAYKRSLEIKEEASKQWNDYAEKRAKDDNEQTALIRDTITLLEEIEWAPIDDAQGPFCPSCKNWELWDEHAPECKLVSMLARLRDAI